MSSYLLAIDQGTTNSRVIIFNYQGQVISQHEMALTQSFPQAGWVEQDPEQMFSNIVACGKAALQKANLHAQQIIAVGLTNQRETTIIWDKVSGKPIYPAIVWQDRRTANLCEQLAQTALQPTVQNDTGLILDPYFSATKIQWLLEHIPGAREKANKGELLFGTVDTYLLWKLTRGGVHATDVTNAARTMLFNIRTLQWDENILTQLNIPKSLLPEVHENTHPFGIIQEEFFGAPLPLLAIAGDQQAALIGQACFAPGMVKSTYGTGCFMVLNTGCEIVKSQNRLLTTIAYKIKGQLHYALEGSIFCAGTVVKWLRDTLHLIQDARETESLAKSIESTDGVYLIPAFTGMGAPYWDADARAGMAGLTRGSGKAHIVRAALESTAYQSLDLLNAMKADCHLAIQTLRVDGGMVANEWLLQFLADMLNIQVERPACIETTALGVAYLAGLEAGIYHSTKELEALWALQHSFHPQMSPAEREDLYAGWRHALKRFVNRN